MVYIYRGLQGKSIGCTSVKSLLILEHCFFSLRIYRAFPIASLKIFMSNTQWIDIPSIINLRKPEPETTSECLT